MLYMIQIEFHDETIRKGEDENTGFLGLRMEADYASFKLDPSSATLGKLRKLLRMVFQSRIHMAVAAEAIRPFDLVSFWGGHGSMGFPRSCPSVGKSCCAYVRHCEW